MSKQPERAERIGKIVHVYMHGDRGRLSGIAANLSRTGALLTVRGNEWEASDLEPDFETVSLRVASHFSDGMKVEFREAGRTVHAEIVRFTTADVDGKKMVCLGCRFAEPLSTDVVSAILQQPMEDVEVVAGELDSCELLQFEGDSESRTKVGLPLKPRGVAFSIHDLLKNMIDRGASDLHIRGNSEVRLRVDGELTSISQRKISPDEAEKYLGEVLTEEEQVRFKRDHDLDFAFALDGVGRFRINALYAQGEVGLVIRAIPASVPTLESLGLAPVCRRIAENLNGLVLVTGPTGSGKSTTLAAMIRHINEKRACHIVTMEDPIEYVHEEARAQITQREIGRDVNSFANALRRAMRQDPDVILVGEMRDLETIALAVTAAETGHLVLGTLHTTSASNTVERIVDVFPPEQQSQIRLQLANSLRAICSQVLVPKIGGGQVVAQEILVANRGVRALIREGKAAQLANMMQTGGKDGMITLEDALKKLVETQQIKTRDALSRSNNRSLALERA